MFEKTKNMAFIIKEKHKSMLEENLTETFFTVN